MDAWTGHDEAGTSPGPLRSRTVEVCGARTRVVIASVPAPRDDPVLLVHGVGAWAENWRQVMPGIAGSGRDAIAMDLPGFGESDRIRGMRYFDPGRLDGEPAPAVRWWKREPGTATSYAVFVHQLADVLEIDRFHLVGQSLGGAIAYMAAVWRPERVRSLTLVAPGGLGAEFARELRLLTIPGMSLLGFLRSSPAGARAALASCFHDPSRISSELLAEVDRYGPPCFAEVCRVLRAGATLLGVRESVRRPWVARAHRYSGPALVIWGEDDQVIPAAHAERARGLAPQADIRLVPSCGHLVMCERPDEFLEILIPFLDGAAKIERSGRSRCARPAEVAD